MAEALTFALVVRPVCAIADAVTSAASRGAAWASLGGLPLLPGACAAMRSPLSASVRDYEPGLAAWRAAHGASAVAYMLLFACLIIPAGRAVAERLFDVTGRRALARRGGKASAAKLKKWREASWKLSSYCFLTAYGLSVTLSQPWARDTQLLWEGWPGAQQHSCAPRTPPVAPAPHSSSLPDAAGSCVSSTPGRWATTCIA